MTRRAPWRSSPWRRRAHLPRPDVSISIDRVVPCDGEPAAQPRSLARCVARSRSVDPGPCEPDRSRGGDVSLRWIPLGAAVCWLFSSSTTLAQNEGVVPPKLSEHAEAPYPPSKIGEHVEADVGLLITV